MICRSDDPGFFDPFWNQRESKKFDEEVDASNDEPFFINNSSCCVTDVTNNKILLPKKLQEGINSLSLYKFNDKKSPIKIFDATGLIKTLFPNESVTLSSYKINNEKIGFYEVKI